MSPDYDGPIIDVHGHWGPWFFAMDIGSVEENERLLDYYGIDLSKNAAPLLKNAERIFSRPAYIEALTPSEKVMRK